MPKDRSGPKAAARVAPTVVQPVAKAVDILRHLGTLGAPATVTQIARALDINTSTCFNILRTLASEGMLVFNDDAKTYTLGLGMVQIAQRALSDNGKIDVLRPLLDDIARTHSVTVTLWRCAEQQRHLVVSVSETTSAFRIQMQVGHQMPLFAGAFGRIMAAQRGLNDTALKRNYDAMDWARPPGLDRYRDQVAQAAQTQWALDDGAFAAGVTNVAVAVPGADGAVRHGIVASLFQGQKDPAQIEDLAQDMLVLAGKMAGLD